MRLITRAEFMTLPPNTVCMEGAPHAYGTPFIKMDNCGDNDYFYDDIDAGALDCTDSTDMFEKFDAMLTQGACFPVDFYQTGRAGCFGGLDTVYAVFESKDIVKLITRLQECVK